MSGSLARSVCLALALAVVACGRGSSGGTTEIKPGTAGHCTLAATGGLRQVKIEAPGPGGPRTARTFELYVPRGVGTTSAVPLLVSLHGTGASGAIQSAATQWSSFDDAQAASGKRFIAVFPDGISTLWLWGIEGSYDVVFVFKVIAEVQRSGCVDPSSIYVDGWSEGAYMAQRMACADGDPAVDDQHVRLAAVHGYAGGNPEVVRGTCGPGGRPALPMRVLMSQGLEDDLIDPVKVGFPAFSAWAARERCSAPAQPYTEIQQLSGCAAGADVAWWPIQDQGHLEWSCSSDVLWHDRGIWAFFTQNQAPTESTCR